jgi:hypothetical protein
MELGIIACLALYGHTCNMYGKARHGTRGSVLEAPLVARGTPLMEIPMERDTTASDARAHGDTLRAQAWQDAHHESQTGVVASGRARPYFTSSAKQATSPVMKQRNMELFTGTLDSCMSKTGFFQKKEERAPLFNPQTNRQRVTSSGTIGNPSFTEGSVSTGDLESRFPTSQYLQNVSPVDPIRVGPGLNVSADVPATGGFQQFYRPPVDNVNAYRKNNLPGRVGAGGRAAVTARDLTPNVVKNKSTVEQFMDPVRPPQAGGGAYTSPVARAAYTTDPGASTAYRPEQYAGGAKGATSGVAPGFGAGTGRQPVAVTDNVWGVNPVGDTFGLGAYTTSSLSNWETKRADTACSTLPPAPPNMQHQGAHTVTHYRAPATLRSLDVGNPNQTYVGPSGTCIEQQGSRGMASYVPRTTTREQLGAPATGFVGQTGHIGQPRARDMAEPSAHGNKKARVLAYTPGGQMHQTPPGREAMGGIRAKGGVTVINRSPASMAAVTDYAMPGAQTRVCNVARRAEPTDSRMCGDAAALRANMGTNPFALPSWQTGVA